MEALICRNLDAALRNSAKPYMFDPTAGETGGILSILLIDWFLVSVYPHQSTGLHQPRIFTMPPCRSHPSWQLPPSPTTTVHTLKSTDILITSQHCCSPTHPLFCSYPSSPSGTVPCPSCQGTPYSASLIPNLDTIFRTEVPTWQRVLGRMSRWPCRGGGGERGTHQGGLSVCLHKGHCDVQRR